ncbi:MAG: phosphomannomutase/phosphoglucomutase, partial [Firmicutes bacterium]|nr:phosphomannomutase/phosphoglucomutase [Bacillota bacterium]
RILAPLGADVSGSQFLEPDGTFPNHAPNPENKEAMASISAKVLETGADFGIIFDTDVDRSSAVDKSGKEISRNAIVAMAAALIAKEHPGTTVVTDSITSDQLTVYLEECLGLKHLRFKRGYKNVINKSIELNAAGTDSQLAIETSGHAAYKENFFLDDGAYLATKIVIKAAQLALQGQGIDVILASLEEPKEAVEVRFPIEGENFGEVGAKVLDDLVAWASKNVKNGVSIVEPNYEGVRLNFRREGLSGWCLLRKSLHDPILPLNVEVTEGSCETILSEIKEFLGGYEQVVIK